MSDVVIRAEGLGKRYRIGERGQGMFRYGSLRDSLANLFTRHSPSGTGQPETIWALKDVSFEIKRGEVVGIIGRNGAGKSTLLKILSRITEPTEGQAEIRGRVGSLLEVGTGFHPELTGRENIFLNGAILGMRKAEIASKFDEIVDFAEVEKFINTPVKHYSSGMYVRLAFAVAAHLEPEILVVDEVLAVGDQAFQKKCLGKIGDVAKYGRTVILVSHNMQVISSTSTHCIRLDKGVVVDSGKTFLVVANYLKGLEGTGDDETISDDRRHQGFIDAKNLVRITRVSFQNSKGEKKRVLFFREPFTALLSFEVLQPLSEVRFGLGICASDGTRVATTHHTDSGLSALHLKRGIYQIMVRIQNILTPGAYHLCVGAHELRTRQGLDFVPVAASFTVLNVADQASEVHDPWNIGPVIVRADWTDVNQ